MRSYGEQQDSTEISSNRELRLLSEVEVDPEVTQRALSKRMGIALGLTNLIMRNLVQKGYVRATATSWKRWLYTLTPDGLSRKVGLTVGYISRFLDHYHNVRQTLREELSPLALNEESSVAIFGTGEFAELVFLGLREIGIEEIDIFASEGAGGGKFLGMPVRDAATLRPEQYDRVVIGDLADWEPMVLELQKLGVAPDHMVTFFADGKTRESA